jgi:hypothetical protein
MQEPRTKQIPNSKIQNLLGKKPTTEAQSALRLHRENITFSTSTSVFKLCVSVVGFGENLK